LDLLSAARRQRIIQVHVFFCQRKGKDMAQNMIEHRAAITVDAPVHQVYSLFSHFNDFPKFMSFVKEVTYYDDQRSHWVADVSGQREWDAVNEDWIPDRQIGWRSTDGLNNYGRVLFQPVSTQQTHIDVSVNYQPPAGLLGSIGERMGVGKHFDDVLQRDLTHFAEMVKQAPAGALDPTSSDYLFHDKSAAARGKTTERQNATMEGAGLGAAGAAGKREDTFVARPMTDQDIVREQGNVAPPLSGQPSTQGQFEPPALDRDIIGEQPRVGGQQAGAMGTPDINPVTPPTSGEKKIPDIPPEQVPRFDNPEGGQPTP